MSRPTRDLMQQIEALRIEQLKHPERADEIRAERTQLREELRLERHREHIADMQMAQSLGEVHFGSLDPTPHRQSYRPAAIAARSWITPVAGTLVLGGIAVGLLLQYFGVLTP